VAGKVPFAEGVRPVSADLAELIRNNTWSATLRYRRGRVPPVVSPAMCCCPEIGVEAFAASAAEL